MQWDEYYDKLGDWATSTAVSRLSQLESFGPADEVTDAINHIGFDDEKGATRLLKKALAAGIKFTGDQLSDFFLICDEDVLNRAVLTSSDQFHTEDLDCLYGFSDEDVLIEIAKKQNIPLPEKLRDYEEALAYDPAEDMPPLTSAELAAEYDYIMQCLSKANHLLNRAYQFSLIDTNRRKREATVMKYKLIAEAQAHIAGALESWTALDIPGQTRQSLGRIWPNISNSTLWQNYLFEGLLTNLMVKRQIRKVRENIAAAIRMVRRLRDAASASHR